MLIEITSVLTAPTPPLVRFDSVVGGAEAIWHGPHPKVGERFVVEIEVGGYGLAPDNLERLEITALRASSIRQNERGMIEIIGELAADEQESGLGWLRVGDGSITLPSSSGYESGQWLRALVRQLALFDTNM